MFVSLHHLNLLFIKFNFFWHQVYDRKSQRLVEELIDKKIVLSMRAIYQSKLGHGLMDIGMNFFIFFSYKEVICYIYT